MNKRLLPLLITLLLHNFLHGQINFSDSLQTHAQINYYDCFSKTYGKNFGGLARDGVTGNLILDKTSKGNFLKYTAVNDSSFVLTCGRANKEFYIGTYNCSTMASNGVPSLKFENDHYMVLKSAGGTHVWSDLYVSLGYDRPIYQESTSYLDTNQMIAVSIHSIEDTVAFKVKHLMHNEELIILSNYHKFRSDGYPTFFIGDVRLSNSFHKGLDSLFYSVEKDGVHYHDTLLVDWGFRPD